MKERANIFNSRKCQLHYSLGWPPMPAADHKIKDRLWDVWIMPFAWTLEGMSQKLIGRGNKLKKIV